MKAQRTLVLNAGYEPLLLVSWQRALCLLFSSKAEVVSEYENAAARTVKTQFQLPSVIRLNQYIHPKGRTRLGIVKLNRKNILIRDKHRCQYCSKLCKGSDATIDHIIPRSLGGKTTWDNVVAACVPCNSKKGSKLLHETSMKLNSDPKRPKIRDIFLNSTKSFPKDWLSYLR